jgi:hypothetical protein
MRPTDYENRKQCIKDSDIGKPNAGSDRKSYRNIRVYTTELPSTRALKKNRFGTPLNKDIQQQLESSWLHKEGTHTDVPQSWLGTMAKPVALYTTHQFLHTAKGSSQWKPKLSLHLPESCRPLKRGGKIFDLGGKELSEDDRITAEREGGILHVSDTTVEEAQEEADEELFLERCRTLDVGQLSAKEWNIVSFEKRIIDLGIIGEGSGGSVTRCILKGGKTIFALKVWIINCYLFYDNHS